MTGCTTTPGPLEAVPAPNVQIRLSEGAGYLEGGATLFGGGVQGTGCVLTVLGVVPDTYAVDLRKGDCRATFGQPSGAP